MKPPFRLRWAALNSLSDGNKVLKDGEPIQLFGAGHGCGAVVLLSGGYAMSATDNGLFVTDTRTGNILWKSLGFAAKACPSPNGARLSGSTGLGGHDFF